MPHPRTKSVVDMVRLTNVEKQSLNSGRTIINEVKRICTSISVKPYPFQGQIVIFKGKCSAESAACSRTSVFPLMNREP